MYILANIWRYFSWKELVETSHSLYLELWQSMLRASSLSELHPPLLLAVICLCPECNSCSLYRKFSSYIFDEMIFSRTTWQREVWSQCVSCPAFQQNLPKDALSRHPAGGLADSCVGRLPPVFLRKYQLYDQAFIAWFTSTREQSLGQWAEVRVFQHRTWIMYWIDVQSPEAAGEQHW